MVVLKKKMSHIYVLGKFYQKPLKTFAESCMVPRWQQLRVKTRMAGNIP